MAPESRRRNKGLRTFDPVLFSLKVRLGAVAGHRTVPLGVEHFGQAGRVSDLYRHYGIDADGIVAAVDEMTAGRPVRLVG